MSDQRDAVIERLEEENDILRARIEQLEDELGWTGHVFPIEWGLTAKEAKVLHAIAGRELCTKEYLHTALYSLEIDGGADIKIIDVFVCKMRGKLRSHGIDIKTRWGAGYWLDATTRAAVLKHVHGRPARISA